MGRDPDKMVSEMYVHRSWPREVKTDFDEAIQKPGRGTGYWVSCHLLASVVVGVDSVQISGPRATSSWLRLSTI